MELTHELNTKSLTLAIVRWSSRAKIILSSAQTKWIDHRDSACGKMPGRYIRLSAQTRTTSEEMAHGDVLNNLCVHCISEDSQYHPVMD